MKSHTTLPSREPLFVFSLCAISFSFGFFSYLGIEKLYKGLFSHSPTHWSMGLVSGLAFLFLLVLDEKKLPLFVKAALGGLFITALELLAGVILNLHLQLGIWDYRESIGNFKGQICPLFSLLWCFASFAVIAANRLITRFVFQAFGKKTPFRD